MATLITRRFAALGATGLATACATGPQTAVTEPPPALDQRLTPLARFLGRWRGAAQGDPGTGTVERSYTPILAGKFIEERNLSRYDTGEIHHHLAFWSHDRFRGRFVLRQFHQESFVNQFVSATADVVEAQLVLDSESIENIPTGFRARETYRFTSEEAFEEIFEIAPPNADFEVYSHNRFTRV